MNYVILKNNDKPNKYPIDKITNVTGFLKRLNENYVFNKDKNEIIINNNLRVKFIYKNDDLNQLINQLDGLNTIFVDTINTSIGYTVYYLMIKYYRDLQLIKNTNKKIVKHLEQSYINQKYIKLKDFHDTYEDVYHENCLYATQTLTFVLKNIYQLLYKKEIKYDKLKIDNKNQLVIINEDATDNIIYKEKEFYNNFIKNYLNYIDEFYNDLKNSQLFNLKFISLNYLFEKFVEKYDKHNFIKQKSDIYFKLNLTDDQFNALKNINDQLIDNNYIILKKLKQPLTYCDLYLIFEQYISKISNLNITNEYFEEDALFRSKPYLIEYNKEKVELNLLSKFLYKNDNNTLN